jgi:hypothetical protein
MKLRKKMHFYGNKDLDECKSKGINGSRQMTAKNTF